MLEVEVLDDGVGDGGPPGTVGGHGLIGMRERVGLHGGHLRAGPDAARRVRRARDLPAERRRRVTISVVLADDQPLVRGGFRLILEAEDDVEVVGEASDGEEAVAATQRLQPDVVLMDVQMPKLDGLEATRRIAQRRERSAAASSSSRRSSRTTTSSRRCARAPAASCSRTPRPEELVHARCASSPPARRCSRRPSRAA